ncbi:MAG: hypothetical protein ACFFEV_06320, partial [Candidatus Thorarchaeota archaeon]
MEDRQYPLYVDSCGGQRQDQESMSLREESVKTSRLRFIGRSILDLPRRITEPSGLITQEIDRKRARFLS